MTVLNNDNFEKMVIDSQEPVVVDFFATWCGPCKMMGPIVEQVEEELSGKAAFGKLDIDQSMEIAGKYGIMSIPTFVVFKEGKPAATHVGGMSKADLKAFIEGAL